MSIQIKVHVEGKVINLFSYHKSVTQNTDYTGRPSAKPVVQVMSFSYESVKKDLFFEKLKSGLMSKYLDFIIAAIALNAKSKKIRVLDFYVTSWDERYDSVNKTMTTYVSISFATLIINDVIIDVKYWRVTDPYAKSITPTTINYNEEKDEKPDVIEYYLTDSKNNKIEGNIKQEIGNTVFLNVHSKNLIGEVLTINLDNEEVDYKHKGVVLKNDTLTDYQINKNIEKIALEVINQKN